MDCGDAMCHIKISPYLNCQYRSMFNGNGRKLFGNREEGEYIKTREQPARFFFLYLFIISCYHLCNYSLNEKRK